LRATRRSFLATLVWPTIARPALGQQRDKSWRVGVLSPRQRPASLEADYYGVFPRRMHELGYVDGRNLVIEWRFAGGDYQRLDGMAGELVASNVDVIVALGPPGVVAARRATTTIPIVFVVSVDPVAEGFVKSLSRPGGNATGISNLAGGLTTKHLELLAAMLGKLSRVALLVNPANTAQARVRRNLEATAQMAGIVLVPVEAKTISDIDKSFATMAAERVNALIVPLDPLFIQQAADIAAHATRSRLPSIFGHSEAAHAGGLLSYGQSQPEIYRHVARYVDRILKGAKPAELPVEQPTKFELVINARTAKALGLAIPPSLAAVADTVIE
jgi:putative ABC transport system substrate-binding protein